jgi:transglutaminase-like putative cysteine protease
MTRNFPEGAAREPRVETANGVKSYTWEVMDSAPLISEPNMPPETDVVPMVQGSIFKDFNEVFALLSGLQKTRMTRTPEVEAAAAEITRGATTQAEKVAKLYHWVQENTRYVSIKGSLGSGMSGHTAAETLHNRYGDCTDKAILLSTLCSVVGVQAWPIILMTNDAGSGVTEIPTLSGNHAITELELNGKRFFLDSTAQDYRYPYFRADDHGAIAYNAIRGEYRTIPVPPPADNRRTSQIEVALDTQGNAAVQTHNLYTGNIEAGVRGLWKQVRDDDRKAMMSEYVNRISPGAILKDFTLTDVHNLSLPLEMKMTYDLPGLGIAAKDLIYFKVPTLERDYPEAALDERTFPVQYMTTEERLLNIGIRLPDGYRLKWAPEPLTGKTPYLEYRLEYRYDKKTRALKLHEEFRRLQRVIPVADYPAYRDALRKIALFSQQEVFITREK